MRQAARLAVVVGVIGATGAAVMAQQSTNPSTGERRRAAVAQQAAVTPPVNSADPNDPTQWVKLSDADPNLATVSFPGGTLAQYFKGIEKMMLAPNGHTTLLPESAARLRLPPLNMRNVRLMPSLEAPGMMLPGITVHAVADEAAENGADSMTFVIGIPPDFLGQPGALVQSHVDLAFPGGTVGEYVEAVRSAQPSANIIISPEAAAFPMPPVQLRSVSIEAAMGAIRQEIGDAQSGRSWVVAEIVETRGRGEPVFRVTANSEPGQSNETIVISLAELLKSNLPRPLKIEDILSAVEAATNMTSPPPKIRFHSETSLLLFHGTADQVRTLQRTVDALRNTATAAE